MNEERNITADQNTNQETEIATQDNAAAPAEENIAIEMVDNMNVSPVTENNNTEKPKENHELDIAKIVEAVTEQVSKKFTEQISDLTNKLSETQQELNETKKVQGVIDPEQYKQDIDAAAKRYAEEKAEREANNKMAAEREQRKLVTKQWFDEKKNLLFNLSERPNNIDLTESDKEDIAKIINIELAGIDVAPEQRAMYDKVIKNSKLYQFIVKALSSGVQSPAQPNNNHVSNPATKNQIKPQIAVNFRK